MSEFLWLVRGVHRIVVMRTTPGYVKMGPITLRALETAPLFPERWCGYSEVSTIGNATCSWFVKTLWQVFNDLLLMMPLLLFNSQHETKSWRALPEDLMTYASHNYKSPHLQCHFAKWRGHLVHLDPTDLYFVARLSVFDVRAPNGGGCACSCYLNLNVGNGTGHAGLRSRHHKYRMIYSKSEVSNSHHLFARDLEIVLEYIVE